MATFALFKNRRFAPLFWTQFLGAFNDNYFKTSYVFLLTHGAVALASEPAENAALRDSLVTLSSLVFILPFFLFSAWSGQIADRFPKHRLVFWIKVLEVAIMALAAWALYSASIWWLLALVFCMGLQSAFFGPVKYGIIPELLEPADLVGGNALVETGTFLAIILGVLAAGLNAGQASHLRLVAGASVIALALMGTLSAARLPPLRAQNPGQKIDFNPVRPIWRIYLGVRKNRVLLLSILGIAWFWLFGSVIMTLLNLLGGEQGRILYASAGTVSLFLALFCVGISIGSLLCERLGGSRVELGLVPLGAIGLSLSSIGFGLALWAFEPPDNTTILALSDFIAMPLGWVILVSLFGLAASGGLFTVPLYTLLQQQAPSEQRSQVFALNNVASSGFMVLGATFLMLALQTGLGIPQVVLALALTNVAVSVYAYFQMPEFFLRFMVLIAGTIMYRVRREGPGSIRDEGAALVVCNHISFVDWLLVSRLSRRPIRFVMWHAFMRIPLARTFFRHGRVIPIASRKDDPELLEQAMSEVSARLRSGDLVCVFPEGKITQDGEMQEFYDGVDRILERDPVPVVPVAIVGMWGSVFSRGKTSRTWGRRRITLRVGEEIPPGDVAAPQMRKAVEKLLQSPSKSV